MQISNHPADLVNSPHSKKIDNFVFLPHEPIAKGSHCLVFKGVDRSRNNAPIAVKAVPTCLFDDENDIYLRLMREIEILRQLKGNHIVQLLDVKKTPNNLYIFMEYCDGGDLQSYLQEKGQLSEKEALSLLKQIVDGFLEIDDLKIKNEKGKKVILMHRDIKPANLLFQNGVLKIADFGFAKFVEKRARHTKLQQTHLGSPIFMSPQILEDEPYSPKCDIWSAGILLYQCLFGSPPWIGRCVEELLANIKRYPTVEVPKAISEETKDLLSRMLKFNEEERIDWKRIAKHPALRDIK